MQDTCDNFNIKNGDSKFNNPLLAGIWNLQKRCERKTSLGRKEVKERQALSY
jgi:hypothetical protein